MKKGDFVRYKKRHDQWDGLLGRIVSVDYSGADVGVELLENSIFIGPIRLLHGSHPKTGDVDPVDREELVLISPLELLAMEAEDE